MIWIVLIFTLSSSAGSSSNTSRFIRPLLEWLFPNSPEEILAVYHGYLRKGAHLLIYGGLASVAWRAFMDSSKTALAKHPTLSALLLTVAVGSVDELNQSYNLLRTGKFEDVLIDLAGAILALVLITAVKAVLSRKTAD